ncbi:GAF domain-containing protein [Psychroflexus aestuariivivens]|uniref:GAF domain-containing protein n=1 Tax=Psychroflexus aestuariivivens TaxID=1795040 RepID=UPI000FD95ED6|nr:GAF domain-containing protein [Psychroflexus aestuariivivens]
MKSENNRLEDLKSYKILDTNPEDELNELAEIASLTCNAPISLITFIDKDRQWFKAKIGLDIPETSRSHSFCQHTLNKPKEVFVINDSLKDDRFKDNPLVINQPNIRFYAGVPLETPDGNVLGTLCVIDHKPHTISKNQEKVLQILSKKAMDYLNTRKIVLNQKNKIDSNTENLRKLTDNIPGGIFQVRMNLDGELKFDFLSEGIKQLHPNVDLAEWKKDPAIGFQLIHPEDLPQFFESLKQSYKNLTEWYNEYRLNSEDDEWHMVKATPEKLKDGSVVWYGSFQDITSHIEYEKTMEQIAFDISHVLRRPVTSLLGLTSLITNEEDLNKINIHEYSENIQEVANELEKFTKDLNDIYHKKREKITDRSKRYKAFER